MRASFPSGGICRASCLLWDDEVVRFKRAAKYAEREHKQGSCHGYGSVIHMAHQHAHAMLAMARCFFEHKMKKLDQKNGS